MADQEQKAIGFIAEAEKKLKKTKGKGLFNNNVLSSMFRGGRSKQEEACDLYVRAANAFKMAKKWPQAGKAFEAAAQLQLAMGSKHGGDAATCYIDAGTSYIKEDPKAAVSAIHKAIEIYTDMGNFSIAAQHHITLAEIYESEFSDIEKAIQNYEQAADYYKGEDSNDVAKICLMKVAKCSAKLENFQKAIEIYEQAATSCMGRLKYCATDYFFRASICHMCMDTINAQVAVKKYEEMLPAFAESMECKLIKNLLQAVEDDNIDQYTKSLEKCDDIFSLCMEPFLTTLILRVKKQLDAEPELC